MSELVQAPWFSLLLLPLLIFLARIIDVSIGTLRIIFVSKGFKGLAALLGFFESLIWVLAISQVFQNLSNWVTYVAFAGGFAVGNYVGILLEERLAMGNQILRVITRKDAEALDGYLREAGYAVTSVDAEGIEGAVKILFMVCKRRDLAKVLGIVTCYNPNAFYTVEDVRFVRETYLAMAGGTTLRSRFGLKLRK